MKRNEQVSGLVIMSAIVLLAIGCNTNDPDKKTDGQTIADTTATDGTIGQLKWYPDCGAPVCKEPSTVTATKCATGQKEGDPCTQEGDTCDPGLGCDVLFHCAKAPVKGDTCPISLRSAKTDIHYLSDADVKKIADDVSHLRLATYRLKSESADQKQLGFIIDDMPGSAAVRSDGKTVNLYGYTSMVAAAVKAQAEQIKALQHEVKQLKSTCGTQARK